MVYYVMEKNRFAGNGVLMTETNRYYRMVSLTMLLIFIVALFLALCYRFYRADCYESAKEMFIEGNYDEARDRFERLGDYRDCESYLGLLSAMDSVEQEQYEDAIVILRLLGDFEDAPSRLIEVRHKYAQYLCENTDAFYE